MGRGPWQGVVVLASVVAVLVAAGTPTGAASPRSSAPGGTSFYDPPHPLPSGPPGALIRWKSLVPAHEAGIPAGARAYLVLYHSRSISGKDIAESGVVVVPTTAPPPGGFPVVSWAHGTTGVADVCAPSRIPSLAIPGLAELVAAGDVVAATDYEGLGTPGVHPYLVGESEGRSVLDAARAAARLAPARASKRVVIFGHSQGGHAALFAGQLAPTYAPDLHVLGVAAGAPVPELSKLLTIAAGLSSSGYVGFVVSAAYAWAHTYSDLPLTDLLTRAAAAKAGIVDRACEPDVQRAYSSLPAASAFTRGFSTLAALQAHLHQNDPGGVPTQAPLLVFQGTADELVPAGITEDFVPNQLCAVDHDTVQLDLFTGASHGGALEAAHDQILTWIAGRFAGMTPPSSCGASPTTFPQT
jgi:pimeloyl-ACP methyl ester carboxylesterase